MTHKHKWQIDKTRKHGRPPRVFVRCTTCTATGQGTMIHGHLSVFRVNSPRFVAVLVDVTPKQKTFLKEHGQSETVRRALDNYIEQVYTTPYNS